MALLYNSKGYADKNFSATRLCWSKGIGGGDAFMGSVSKVEID
jgi:hypothetical protein